jgi:hypothetical protein
MPALIYAQLAEKTDEALSLLRGLPGLKTAEDRRARGLIKEAGTILQAVLRGLQDDLINDEDEDGHDYPAAEEAVR